MGLIGGEVAIMYPHKMFAHLYHDHYGTFKDVILGGDDENIRTFWSQMAGHPSFANHPMHHHQLADFRKYGVPLQLYGDGTPAVGVGKAWSKMVTGITWSSALKKISDVLVKLLHYILV